MRWFNKFIKATITNFYSGIIEKITQTITGSYSSRQLWSNLKPWQINNYTSQIHAINFLIIIVWWMPQSCNYALIHSCGAI